MTAASLAAFTVTPSAHWCLLQPEASSTERSAAISSLLENRPALVPYRPAITRALDEACQRAAARHASRTGVVADVRSGQFTTGVMMAAAIPPPALGDSDLLGWVTAAFGDYVAAARLDWVPIGPDIRAVRARTLEEMPRPDCPDVRVVAHRLRYYVPTPDAALLAAFDFSTSDLRFADRLTAAAEELIGTFRWIEEACHA